jgi:hypothetical protein
MPQSCTTFGGLSATVLSGTFPPSTTITLRKNGVDTAVICTLVNGGVCTSAANIAISAGDKLHYFVSAAPTTDVGLAVSTICQ